MLMTADLQSLGHTKRRMALGGTMVTLLLSLVVYAYTAYTVNESLDGLSLALVLLTSLLYPAALLSGQYSVRKLDASYLSLLLVMETILLIVFMTGDLLVFYIAFEASLVPMVIVIGVWGSGAARLRAAYLFFLFALAGSLLMLLALLYVWSEAGTVSIDLLGNCSFALSPQVWLWSSFALALAVKTPLYPFHLWLYRAHAEAPVAGSVLLAGVVLKLATYGYVRILLGLFPEASAVMQPLVFALAGVTLVLSSLSVTRQSDVKAVIALSSVGHMAIVTLGLGSLSSAAITGSLLLSLAHGLVSPALFIIVGGVLYDRYHTRLVRYYRGLVFLMPLTVLMFFIASCANMAVPLTLNWLSEVLIIVGVFPSHPLMAVLTGSSVFLGAVYSVWLYSRMSYGT